MSLTKRQRQVAHAQSRIDYWKTQKGIRAKARLAFWRKRRKNLRKLVAKLSSATFTPPKAKLTFRSVKNWLTRPPIREDLFVLHSTESPPLSGIGVSNYLSHGSTQADVHDVVDSDGTLYRLVPHGRKAWHVAAYNSRARGVEQVGRAAQDHWPPSQLDLVARLIVQWHRDTGNPIRDARDDLTEGVVTHSSLGSAGGGHHDPGKDYPFGYVLSRARQLAQQ